ncbi:MAG: toll/interleukin-1 receptor domain-containing protein [Treponema sp.]|nr:toll/interleukin-1 receptor domain-containing protein [Treponema sp.]
MDEIKDFFISYKSTDEKQAIWIAETLEKEGYSTIIQAWDFRAGGNFIEEMDKALKNSKHLIAVWSKKYFESMYCNKEWTAAFTKYATETRAIIPVRISNVKPEGLLASIIYIDLFRIKESKRAEVLINGIKTPERRGDKSIYPRSGIKNGAMAFNNLPHSQNRYFTGRKDILDLINKNFKSKDLVSFVQSINGLGGVGKSSIVLEYAYRNLIKYETIWWVNSSSFDTTLSSFMKFALDKKLITEEAKAEDVVEEMKYWFSNNDNWLFIYDNADADDFKKWLEPFFPKSGNGHVLITTRNNFFPKSKSIDIVVFDETEAVSFMKNRIKKDSEGYSVKLAKILSKRLQYLPLALEQAAAYMVETPGVTYQDYIDLIDKYGTDILKKKI